MEIAHNLPLNETVLITLTGRNYDTMPRLNEITTLRKALSLSLTCRELSVSQTDFIRDLRDKIDATTAEVE